MRWISNGALFEFDNARAGRWPRSPVRSRGRGRPGAAAGSSTIWSIVTRSLDTLLGENLPAALGLTTGFSQLDGD